MGLCNSLADARNGGGSALPVLEIPALQQKSSCLWVVPFVGQLPAQRIGEPIVSVEQKRNVERIAYSLGAHAHREHGTDPPGGDRIGCERECLQKPEHRAKRLVDRSGLVVRDHQSRRVTTERCLRDRGVSVGSEDALVEPRDERREELALAGGPWRRAPHHALSELGKFLAEETLPIEQRANDAGCVTGHDAHGGELELVRKWMTAVNAFESHASSVASSRARRPANSRLLDAPRAALTMTSNSSSSLREDRRRAMSESVTLYAWA